MTETLFIGGVADGKRIAVPDKYPYWRLPEERADEFTFPPKAYDDFAVKVHDYERIEFRHGLSVFLHKEIHPDRVIGILIDNYKKA